MRYLFTLLFLSLNSYSFVDSEFLQLSKNQDLINQDILFQETQNEIEKNTLSPESLKLIVLNKSFQEDIQFIEENDLLSSDPCDEIDKKEKEKKKKKKNRSRKVQRDGWQIIASVKMNNYQDEQKYEHLAPPESDSFYFNRYSELRDSNSIEELKNKIREHTKDMNDNEYLSYLSQMTGLLPYNQKKSKFDQSQQGIDTLFSMLQEDKAASTGASLDDDWGGICGDIHFATVLMGETARPEKYEYFTASYVTAKMQHVYSFAVDKNNPERVVVINYGSVQISDQNNGIESALIKNSSNAEGFNNVGGKIRIYKHSGLGLDNQKKSEHVATIPTAIGSFLQNIALEDHQKSSMPGYQTINTQVINFENNKTVTKEVKDEDGNILKSKSFDIAQGVKFIHGDINSTDTGASDIFTVAVYRKKDSNTDGFGNIVDSKKLGKESNLSLSSSIINQNYMDLNEKQIYLRLNYYQGFHKTLISSDKVDIQANTGINLNADYIKSDKSSTYDGDLETFFGIDTKVKLSQKDQVGLNIRADQSIGLKEERAIFDYKSLPSNLQLTPNAIRADLNYTREISSSATMKNGVEYTGTQIGALVKVHSDFQIQKSDEGAKHFITVSYTKPISGFNPNIKSNLLPIQENIQTQYGIQKGPVAAGAYFQYNIQDSTPFIGGSLKVDVFSGKKKKKK